MKKRIILASVLDYVNRNFSVVRDLSSMFKNRNFEKKHDNLSLKNGQEVKTNHFLLNFK